jgi:hypothetical protein
MNSEDWHLIANVPAPEDGTRVVFFSPTKGQWIGNEPLGHGRGDWVWDGVNWLGKSQSLSKDETHWAYLRSSPRE